MDTSQQVTVDLQKASIILQRLTLKYFSQYGWNANLRKEACELKKRNE